jgi:DNA-binding response OmpR family regulator
LNYEGYQVSVAYDGLTALMAARELDLDLVILDWMLPQYCVGFAQKP